MNCLSCTAETTNGLALCEACQIRAAIYLEFLPVYFGNLARWRPGRAGSRPVAGSRIPKGVIPEKGDEVGNALNQAGSDLDTWARCLTEDRGVEIPAAEGEASVVRVLCWVFSENLTSIATLEWAGLFVNALGEHEALLRSLTEKVAPGWYAGTCRDCETPTHVVPGLTWVTCPGCGTTTYARDHLEIILAEARGWVSTPIRLAGTLVALMESETSVDDLRKRIAIWGTRGHIQTVRATNYSEKRYRLGEVMDRLAASAQESAA